MTDDTNPQHIADELVQFITDNIPGTIYQFLRGADGTISFPYISPQCYKFFGLHSEAIMADATLLFAQVHPDDSEHVQQAIDQSAQTMQPYAIQHRVINKQSGAVLWLDVHSTPKRLDNDDILWNGIATDITEHKQVQETYRAIVEHSLQGLLIIQDGWAVFANRAIVKITGYSVEEYKALSTEKGWNIVHPEDRERVQGYYQDRMAGKEAPEHYEWRLIRKDGEIRWVEMQATVIGYQGKPAIQATFVDITERKQAEITLRESEERLKQAIQIARLGIWDWEFDSDTTRWFGEMFAIYGITPEEFTGIGTDYIEFTREDYREQQRKNIELAFEKGVTEKQLREGVDIPHEPKELCIVRSDGTEAYTIGDAISIIDEDGNPVRMLGTTLDITERKQTEKALQLTSEELERFFSLVPDLVCIASTDGYFKKLNPAWQTTLGFSIEELLSQPFESFIHPDDVEPTRQEVAQQIEGQRTILFTNRYRTKDGSYRLLEWMATPAVNNTLLFAAARDITERKQAEEALRESETRFRAIIEQSAEGVLLYDRKGAIQEWNRAMERFTGLQRSEVLGRFAWDVHHQIVTDDLPTPTKYEEIKANTLALLAQKSLPAEGMSYEIGMRNTDGNVRLVSIFIFLIEYKNQELFVNIIRDITERKQAEEELHKYKNLLEDLVKERTAELQTAHERLQELDHLKDEFISSVSHELRTPLTILKTNHHLLGVKPEKSATLLGRLTQATNRMEQIVESMLFVPQLHQALQTMTPGELDLNRLVHSVVKVYQMVAKGRELTLTFEEEVNLPHILGDPDLLTRVVEALLDNALKYTPAHGQVRVTTQSEKQDGKEGLSLTVADTGMGISPDELPRVFDRFFRGKVALETTTPGSGLGLFIVKEIIERHQGSIRVESQPEQETRFIVWLPFSAH